MGFIVYRQQQAVQAPPFQLVLGDWEEVLGVSTVPLFSSATTKFIDLVPADPTAIYGRKALITLETSEIVVALGRDVTTTDKTFIPPGGNIELEVGKQKLSASVFTDLNPASVQVWTAKYLKITE